MSRVILLALTLRAGFEVGDPKAPAPAPKKTELVWSTNEVVEKGGDRTFTATGTRRGQRYTFRARGVCVWQSITLYTRYGLVRRERIGEIFGIDFRVMLGSGAWQF